MSSVRPWALSRRHLSFPSREGQTSRLYQTPLWPLSCSVNLHAGLTEVTEREKRHVPALQLSISPHGVACESSLTRIDFIFSCKPRAVALLLTGHVPIGQSQSILVACQPQMPEACPRFLSPYTMKSAGSHSLQLRKVASYAVLGRWGQVLMKASRCYCNSNNN